MNILPGQTRALHFIGIGGIGMSGIAEVLHQSGFKVQGADITESYNTKRLQSLGISVFIGHDVKNLSKVQAVVISTAVKPDNIELLEARRLRIPVMHRSEMLAEIMRSRLSLAVGGTHGKTTTTSLLAWLIDAAGMDPTVVNGGIINEYNTNGLLLKPTNLTVALLGFLPLLLLLQILTLNTWNTMEILNLCIQLSGTLYETCLFMG
jgi:UDP-N-acetylmuramate--alanine ligase